jgi:spermidine/putrescine-binding protein
MKKMMTYCFLGLFLGGAALLACSNNNEAESEPEKGRIEKMTDKAAKKMVKRIRTPINKARSVKDQQEDRLNDMDESLKE